MSSTNQSGSVSVSCVTCRGCVFRIRVLLLLLLLLLHRVAPSGVPQSGRFVP